MDRHGLFITEEYVQQRDSASMISSEEFGTWRDHHIPPHLWVSGYPGTGKTTLTNAISNFIQTGQRVSEIVVTFYFDGRYLTSNPILDILWSILDQLEMRDDARSLFAREMRGGFAEFTDSRDFRYRLPWPRVKDSFNAIKHEIRSDETLILILDGLDEVEDAQHDILHGFIAWATRYDPKHRIKCVISSHPDFLPLERFRGALRMDTTQRVPARKNLDIFSSDSLTIPMPETSTEQLPSFMPTHSPSYYPSSTHVDGEVSPRNMAITNLHQILNLEEMPNNRPSICIESHLSGFSQERLAWSSQLLSHGVIKRRFLRARLALRTLSKTGAITGMTDEPWGNLLKREFSSTYQYMLRCIPENDRPTALLMLKWVTYAARPLYISELLDVLNSQLSIRLTVLDIRAKSGYILTTSEDQTVNFIHRTARDYLRSNLDRDVRGIPGWDLAIEANEMLAHTCLQALDSEHLLQSLNLPKCNRHHRHHANERLQNLQDYASRYWMFHYRLAEHRSSYLPGFLHGILKNVLQEKVTGYHEECPLASYGGRRGFLDFSIVSSESALQNLNTALRAGASFGFEKFVQLELEMGADSHIVAGHHEETALHLAAKGDHTGVVRLLLQYGADVDARSNSGKTPLFYAIAQGEVEVVKVLLANGANTQGQDAANIISRGIHLTAAYLNSCTDCGEIRAHYVVSNFSFMLSETQKSS
jgi:hypothetical protein